MANLVLGVIAAIAMILGFGMAYQFRQQKKDGAQVQVEVEQVEAPSQLEDPREANVGNPAPVISASELPAPTEPAPILQQPGILDPVVPGQAFQEPGMTEPMPQAESSVIPQSSAEASVIQPEPVIAEPAAEGSGMPSEPGIPPELILAPAAIQTPEVEPSRSLQALGDQQLVSPELASATPTSTASTSPELTSPELTNTAPTSPEPTSPKPTSPEPTSPELASSTSARPDAVRLEPAVTTSTGGEAGTSPQFATPEPATSIPVVETRHLQLDLTPSGLARQIRTPDPEIREVIAWVLGEVAAIKPRPAAIAPLAQLLKTDPDPKVRAAAAIALGKFRSETVVPLLLQAQRQPSLQVQQAAARALASLKYAAPTAGAPAVKVQDGRKVGQC